MGMDARLRRLAQALIAEGHRRLDEPAGFVEFTRWREADELINDFRRYPHAFVMACIADRQVKSDRAWRLPYELKKRLGTFEFADLARMGKVRLKHAMEQAPRLHRFPQVMADYLHNAICLIKTKYAGDASRIWAGRPSSATVVLRFLEFDGVGQKIATMAANILVRDFRIPMADFYSIDISLDRQVRRVFERMGFVPEGARPEIVIYRARELNPDYPGIFDSVLWEVGRTTCGPRAPVCDRCEWASLCRYAQTTARSGAGLKSGG